MLRVLTIAVISTVMVNLIVHSVDIFQTPTPGGAIQQGLVDIMSIWLTKG